MEYKRILITRTDRLGDVVLSTPIIRFMRKMYPSAYIAFMVRPENRDVVENNPHLDEVIVYDKYGLEKSFWKTFLFALKLRKKKFDVGIALHPTNRTHIILFLVGIPSRIGYDRKMPRLLTRAIAHEKEKGEKHEIDYNFDLLTQAGFNTERADRRPYIVTSDDDKKLVRVIKKEFGIGENVIAFHIGASCPSKRWAPEKFAYVADKLAEKYRADIVLIGAEETGKFADEMIAKMKTRPISLIGALLIGELAEFLAGCRVFISNDSGPVHVAVAVKTSTIVIFGRSDPGLSPKRWAPAGEKDIVLHRDAGCGRCLAHNCEKDFACLKAVTAEEVLEGVERVLGGFYSRRKGRHGNCFG
ncbi:MAG: glycosyltransferase family 9 protein [Candidatus Omnitrophica bacterium]|nr:glycosyltransferase family 9 protein [Candidatus Omnitrophota bacterium]